MCAAAIDVDGAVRFDRAKLGVAERRGEAGEEESCIYGKQLSRKRSGIGHVAYLKKRLQNSYVSSSQTL